MNERKRTGKHLVEAVRAGEMAVVEALLRSGAKGTSRQLVDAARAGEDAVVDALIRSGAKGTPEQFAEAVRTDEKTVIDTLLRSDMDVTTAYRVLMMKGGNDEALKILAAAGANVHEAIHGRPTTLHEAAQHPDPSFVKNLIAAGADPNAKTKDTAETPLHFAARNPFPGVVETLIEGGANPNARDNAGRTPLHFAVSTGGPAAKYDAARAHKPKAIAALIAAGADSNARDNNGQIPLHNAFMYVPAAGALLAGGANPNARANSGRTPLHSVLSRMERRNDVGKDALARAIALAKVLIEAGADVDARPDIGNTPREILHSLPIKIEGIDPPRQPRHLARSSTGAHTVTPKSGGGCMVTLATLATFTGLLTLLAFM